MNLELTWLDRIQERPDQELRAQRAQNDVTAAD